MEVTMRATAWAVLLWVGCAGPDAPPDPPEASDPAPPPAPAPDPLALEQVTSGLVTPVALAGDLEGRLFIADEPGVVYEMNGALRLPVLDLRDRDVRLQAVAVPDRQQHGRRVFVRYLRGDRARVSAFTVERGGDVREDVLVDARIGDPTEPVGLDYVNGRLRLSGPDGVFALDVAPPYGGRPLAPAPEPTPRLDGLGVVGGHRYVGLRAPELAGRYVFATPDALFTAAPGRVDGERWRVRRLDVAPGGTVRALAEDRAGELYVLVDGGDEGDGRVLRVVSTPREALAGSASRGTRRSG